MIARARQASLHDWALAIHRYVGLVTSVFLLVAGVTGSVIAFYVPLDVKLNPELFLVSPPTASATLLDPFVLMERLNQQLAEDKRVTNAILRYEPGRSVNYWVDGEETFVDPYTGKIIGRRHFGDLSEGKQNWLTFLYRLHFTLALGDPGMILMGVIALLWTVDCFVSAYLTFPRAVQRRAAGPSKAWFRRWLPMWFIKTNKLITLVFTWHRASGLWIWAMLLVFAWSGVALNLPDLYNTAMRPVVGQARDALEAIPELPAPIPQPPIPLRDAHAIGRGLMASEASRRGFRVLNERGIDYRPDYGDYIYTVESSLDISERLAQTSVAFDAGGRQLAFSAPLASDTASSVSSWLIALHFGAVRGGGLAYRSFVSIMGVAVALLSVTGVWIWWRKRPGRAARRGHHAGAQ